MYYTWYTLCLAFSPVKFHVLISYREGSLQELQGQQGHQRKKDSGGQLHSTELYSGAELVVSGVLVFHWLVTKHLRVCIGILEYHSQWMLQTICHRYYRKS